MKKEGHFFFLTTPCQLLYCELIAQQEAFLFVGGNWCNLSFKISVVLSSRHWFLSHGDRKLCGATNPSQPLPEGAHGGSAFVVAVVFPVCSYGHPSVILLISAV